MKDSYYLLLLILGITIFTGAMCIQGWNAISTTIYTSQGTIAYKQPIQNGYMLNFTNGNYYEIKNNAFLTNATSLYDDLLENHTYQVKMVFGGNGTWNIISATQLG